MAANDVDLVFAVMSEVELRQWVEANPGRVNDRDSRGATPLWVAVYDLKSVALVRWLVKERGADVNLAEDDGSTPLHFVESLDVLSVLLECGADPTLQESDHGATPLVRPRSCTMWCVII